MTLFTAGASSGASSFLPAVNCVDRSVPATQRVFPVQDYNLDATLASGQTFRWRRDAAGWNGVIGRRWVRLQFDAASITAHVAEPATDWKWLADYLQIETDLGSILATFPDDAPMRAAVGACRGLRLLRQDPWECLASFILSSTKQIVQIEQVVALVCEQFGEPVSVPSGAAPARAFPSPDRIADAAEAALRACKMGFRAPYLRGTAQLIACGNFDLERLRHDSVEHARAALMELPGVGRKIADCVLLFAYGFASAFPVDVWVMKALRQLYFPRRRPALARLHGFAATHFGPNAGYAQQYLFHCMRTHPDRLALNPETPSCHEH
jgi:N-glycosylase/DNA lyase